MEKYQTNVNYFKDKKIDKEFRFGKNINETENYLTEEINQNDE